MSYYVKTYIGSFVTIKNPKKKVTSETLSCPKKGCIKHKLTLTKKFCCECGSEAAWVTVEDLNTLPFDAYTELNEKLVSVYSENGNEEMVLIPNVPYSNGGQRLNDGEWLDIDSSDIEKQHTSFTKNLVNNFHIYKRNLAWTM
jgi:hypothetical protein